MNKIVVILPTYNEKGNVEPMTTQILQQNDGIDVLIIDDNSPDGTGEIAKKLSESNPRVKFISRPGKLGLGSAYYKGFRYGYDNGYDYIFSIDSDFSHDPKYLPEMIAAMDNGADLTVGSRYVPGGGTKNWPLHRRLL
ncbi:MAG: glycosyltransferase, partial [Elusimicrobiota bacterium]